MAFPKEPTSEVMIWLGKGCSQGLYPDEGTLIGSPRQARPGRHAPAVPHASVGGGSAEAHLQQLGLGTPTCRLHGMKLQELAVV